MNKLIEAIEKAQAVLARQVLPPTDRNYIRPEWAINELLGILDNREFLKELARSKEQFAPVRPVDSFSFAVMQQVRERAEVGFNKYGVTVGDRSDLAPRQWLKHLQEEMLDGAVYIEKLMQEMPPSVASENT